MPRRNPDEIPCFACGAGLKNIMGDEGFQPSGGLAFLTYGHYGSTFFDPIDGTALEIAICDNCLMRFSGYITRVSPGVTPKAEYEDWWDDSD